VTKEGIRHRPLVADIVRMKLASFRLKDRVHIQDIDSVGLITPDIEAGLSDPMPPSSGSARDGIIVKY
jgi:hypothetical protein